MVTTRRSTDPEGVGFPREVVIDPVEHLRSACDAANVRQDDLRDKLEEQVDRRFAALEKAIDSRFIEIKELIHAHDKADQDSFGALRREMSQHNTDDAVQHANILTTSSERMTAMKDLLSASINGVNRSNEEVKKNVEGLEKTVVLNQQNGVSMDTFGEFKRGVETREKVFNDFMLSNQGERTGIKNFWGQIVAAAIGGAALVSVIQFLGSHVK